MEAYIENKFIQPNFKSKLEAHYCNLILLRELNVKQYFSPTPESTQIKTTQSKILNPTKETPLLESKDFSTPLLAEKNKKDKTEKILALSANSKQNEKEKNEGVLVIAKSSETDKQESLKDEIVKMKEIRQKQLLKKQEAYNNEQKEKNEMQEFLQKFVQQVKEEKNACDII